MRNTTYTGTLVPISCINCGTVFGMEQNLDHERQRDHGGFYCPNGHRQWYTGESNEEQLRRQLEATRSTLTHERDQHEATRRSNAALKGVITKARRRVGKGVCPCCKRSFPQLREHMATEHPEYADARP